MQSIKCCAHVPRQRLRFAAAVPMLATLMLSTWADMAAADEAQCTALLGKRIEASTFVLPTSGGKINVAEYHPANSSPAPATPSIAYCKLVGVINPVDPTAPLINFQVNLPEPWNGKVVQYGGGGLNGTLITGLAPLRDAPPTVATPIDQGYVTLGTDAGHQNQPTVDLQQFALNDEALRNHAEAAYKKTHDAALELISWYYARKPSRFYYFGASEGGREGLIGAQRFPQDYDGIVSIVPVAYWTGLNLSTYNHWQLQQAGGWMNAAKIRLVADATLKACDKLDGIADGVIGRYADCNDAAELRKLRCADGSDQDAACLSDAQLALINAARSPFKFKHPVAQTSSFPRMGIGGEAQVGGLVPAIVDAEPNAMLRTRYAVGDIRYFIVKDPTFTQPLDEDRYAARIREVSKLMDAADPDLSAFAARGGKLILKGNGSDYVSSSRSVAEYYRAVARRMGQRRTDQFVRLYEAPGVNHAGQGVRSDGSAIPDRVDLLSALDAWVEQGKPPGELTLTNFSDQPAHASQASWPLCVYPNYPHYRGEGDPKQAASYRCKPQRAQ